MVYAFPHQKRSSLMLQLLIAGIFSALPVAAFSACEQSTELSAFARETYSDAIEFEVLRNGSLVGKHRTEFSRSDAGLHVHSAMALTVRVFFIPVFEFRYDSSATWCGNGVKTLQSSVERNGEKEFVAATFDGAVTTIESTHSRATAPTILVPTNHWYPGVLQRSQVLNTITGRVNAVQIVPCRPGRATELGLALPAGAECFSYTGDLSATVWYLGERWIGLAFKGDDGSDIVYRCARCRTL